MPQNTEGRVEGIEGWELIKPKFPEWIQDFVEAHQLGLEEFCLDIGHPISVKRAGQRHYSKRHVEPKDLEKLLLRFSFRPDGRAGVLTRQEQIGMPGLLHRVSRITDREDMVIGIRFRVGRFMGGVADSITDWVMPPDGQVPSILLCGPPGGGKTTLLRSVVAMVGHGTPQRPGLGKGCVIVDTSSEIAGDGQMLHPGLGFVSRIQVKDPREQATVLTVGLKNTTAEVVVCDEIGYHDDVEAIHALSKMGVGVICTAHGNSLLDVMDNKKFSLLLGHYQIVERRRVTRPAFKTLITIEAKGVYRVYPDLALAVDQVIAGDEPECRVVGPNSDAWLLANQPRLKVA